MKTKDERIKDEMKKLSQLYKTLPSNKKELLTPMMQNAAFMKATLEDLQQIINDEGATDEYCNGANQFGKKPSANIQAYNTMVKNYTNIIEKLNKLLPAEAKESRLGQMIDE